MTALARRASVARKIAGLSVTETARAIRANRRQIQRLEQGRGGLPLWCWRKLADAYGVSLDYLAGSEMSGPRS